ncbi:MAG: putative ABC transporter permease [Eggerthellales bacterium]|nr:putative ABC transporter permease [Eggerthellales bacterium]
MAFHLTKRTGSPRCHHTAETPVDERRVSLIMRIYGAASLVLGLLALVITVFLAVVLTRLIRQLPPEASLDTITIIALVVLFAMLTILSVVHVILGVAIIVNRRKYAARVMLGLMAATVVAILADVLVSGVTASALALVALLIGQLIISSYLDPSLSEERQLNAKLRQMDDRQRAEEGTLGRDLSGKGYITLNFFNVFWIFFVCCILGDIIEVIYVWVLSGSYMNRTGMLFGSFSPIYGFGALILTMCLNRFYNKGFVPIFLVSAVVGGAFEFFVSWFLEMAFGVVAWDYTGTFLSIDGRTNFRYMVMWGILGTVWIKFLLPWVLNIINLIPWKSRYTITTVVASFMLVNAIMTVQALDCWTARCADLPIETPLQEFYNKNFPDEYMQDHFQTMTVNPDLSARL